MTDDNRVCPQIIEESGESFYRNMTEQLRDIILVVDVCGNIINANHAAIAAYGYTIDELRGLRVHDLRAPETRGAVDAQLRIAQTEGTLFRTTHMRRTGECFPVEVSSRCFSHSGKEIVVSIVRDITTPSAMEASLRKSEESYRLLTEELTAAYEELRASEEELRQQFDELLAKEARISQQNIVLNLVHETALGLMHRLDLDEVLRSIIASAAHLLGVADGFINLVVEKRGVFVGKVAIGLFAQDMTRQIAVTDGLVGQAYSTGEIAVVNDYSTWEQRLPDRFFDKLHCCVVVPLMIGQKVIGTFGLVSTEPGRTLAEHEISLLKRFADMASIALDNATLVTSYKNELLVRTKAEEAVKVSEAKYRTVFEAANDGIYIYDVNDGKILDINDKACEMFGHTREEMLASDSVSTGTGEAPYGEKEFRQWIGRAAGGEPQLFEWRKKCKDGRYIWVEISLKRTPIGEDDCILAIVRDISERKAQEQAIWRLAYSDSLTGLPNRAYLREFLDTEMEKARRGAARGAILFIDLDDLKMINDTFGHSYGDGVIAKAAASIVSEVGQQAVVTRIGGDEFIVVLPGKTHRDNIRNVADNMVKALCRDYEVGPASTYMSASAGIALYPEDGATAEDILKNADLALYEAKSNGKNTWRFYESGLQKSAYENMLLKQALRDAIKRDELCLHYQPLVDTYTAGVVSFEALLRWTSPDLGSVPPGRFIPLAEESDTIQTIGRWVIREACQFARRLREIGRGDIRVSVNVSPRQLVNLDFVPLVGNAIAMAGINPNQLEIEITEHALIASLEDSVRQLKELRALGVRLALDDFGSGYCSLLYLKNLPVETLKMDKSFIEEISFDETQLRFVNSIVNMAHVQRLSIVAEGVETEMQLKMLKECQCDYIQGYLFGRPMPAEQALLFLDR